MPRLPCYFRLLPLMLAALLALVAGGCADSDRVSYASELDEPDYREGQVLLKAGRRQEALTAFLKVIDKRGDAPESHLSVGLLYVQHINDPLSAIYHFRKYLALRPNSQQAPLVRQRINAAIREFARTLPAQPLEGQAQRVDLVAALDRLKQENDSLKQQLADAKAGRGALASVPASPEIGDPTPAPTAPNSSITFSLEPEPTVRTRTQPVAPSRSSPTQIITPPATRPMPPASTPTIKTAVSAPKATAPTSAPRKHIVRPKETLMQLAQRYYNDRSRWRDIYAANRGVMRNESDMKVGTELKIP